ncbi:hypothetical protein U719_13475 [Exiguobacterium sp. MH3]|nr:hypothetical protein U719_13475 [Exiguobacterium sp. MH3]
MRLHTSTRLLQDKSAVALSETNKTRLCVEDDSAAACVSPEESEWKSRDAHFN